MFLGSSRGEAWLVLEDVQGWLKDILLFAWALTHRGPGRPPIGDDPQEVLEHPRRRRIYELIEERPGISGAEIQRVLDFAVGVVENHLKHLLRVGLVEKRHSGPFVHYYPAGKAPDQDDPVLLLPATRSVGLAVLRNPGTMTHEIVEDTQLTRTSVNNHLRVLAQRGFVKSTKKGWYTYHEPTGALRKVAKAWQRTP